MPLDEMTYKHLFKRTETEESAIIFAQELGLLPTTMHYVCGLQMHTRKRMDRGASTFIFVSKQRHCRKEVSIRKGSWFLKAI